MNPRRIYGVFLRQLFIMRNLPSRIVPYFLFAILDIILWGFITKYLNASGPSQIDFVATLLGAVILWDFMQRVQQGITIPFLEDVWARNLLNIFASPLRLREYVAGFILSSTATSFFGLVVMLALAQIAFGFSLFSLGLLIFPFLLLLFLFGIVVGMIAASIVLRFGPYAEWFVWPIPAILSPFVGVFYPVSTLPHWMQLVSHALPPSYVFEGMRSALVSGEFALTPLLVGFVLTFVYFLLAYALFAFIYSIVVKRGMIARFSAEG